MLRWASRMAQSCPRVAVLAGGRLAYHGTTRGLVDVADGRTFVVRAPEPPADGFTVVNVVSTADGTVFRVAGPVSPPGASAVEPTRSSDGLRGRATPRHSVLRAGVRPLRARQAAGGWRLPSELVVVAQEPLTDDEVSMLALDGDVLRHLTGPRSGPPQR